MLVDLMSSENVNGQASHSHAEATASHGTVLKLPRLCWFA